MTATSTMARIDELVARARAETGLEDFGGDTWRDGLEVLVGSALTESRFNDFGEQMFYGGLVRTLANRLHVEDWFARHPEIDDQEVHVELLGVGFPRTGSTALSHLLGEDTAVRSLRMWESAAPCPPPGVSPADDDDRIAAAMTQIAAQEQALPQFRSMLPQSATGPMEDHELMALEFKAQYFLASARLPSYAEWFLDCDMEPTYRYERRVLKLLQWRCPPNRWQLKSPTHTLFLDAFEATFPEARYVMTHRGVENVLPSVADLYCTLMQGGNTTVDKHEVGRLNLEQWGTAIDRSLAFRADGREAQVLRHRLHRLPGRPDRAGPPALRMARKGPHPRDGAAHARVARGEPTRQARNAPLRRRRLRHDRRGARNALRRVPGALRPAAAVAAKASVDS